MKKIILCTALLISSGLLFAQSDKYVAAMKTNIALIDSSFTSTTNMVSLANNFERIAMAEKSQWLPYYYAAFCQVSSGFMEQDKSKCDAIADKATSLLNKADSLSPNNSEISCVKSMIAICHLLVNPMQRYMEYGMASETALQDAMKQDDSNPRPYYLKGQTIKNTPEQFGGGCKAASDILNIALQKYASFKPVSDLYPNWGLQRTKQILDECK
ncbi:MAG: hypothetical protein JSU03_01590 [Bacteroidetes bacterium]|nr:hypothetical protein [Bacteroidota bacterium]